MIVLLDEAKSGSPVVFMALSLSCHNLALRLRVFLETDRRRPIRPLAFRRATSSCWIRIACNSALTAPAKSGASFVRRSIAATVLVVSGILVHLPRIVLTRRSARRR